MKDRVDELIIEGLRFQKMSPMYISVIYRGDTKVNGKIRHIKYILMNGTDFNDLVIDIMRTSNDPKELKDIEQMKYKGHRIISSYDIEEGKLELI